MTPEAFAALMDRSYVEMQPWSAASVAETMAAPHTLVLSRPGGGCLARIVAGDCEILSIATDPAMQRRGIASSLVTELLGIAAEAGADTIFLEVASRNQPARDFYAAQGFAQVGLRRGYYTLRDGSHDDALLLSRPVAQGHTGLTPAS